MNNTRVIDRNDKFDKDKTSEKEYFILPEKATYIGDGVDKWMWTKYRYLINLNQLTFVSPRV